MISSFTTRANLLPADRREGLPFSHAKTMKYVLCQDCLSVLPYSDDRHNEIELCACGGQLCGCTHCHELAVDLLTGKESA